ncbi:MAG: ABC transporter ATP-binding protein [Pseudomonadota bacterium]|nr:ABC transporter ATP-binding protein [Pseudomonadota bacterium]
MFISLVIGAIAGLTITNTAMVWLIGLPFDHLQAGRFDQVKSVLLWLALIVVINQGFHLLSMLMANWLGLRFVGRLRQAALRHLLNVSAPGAAHLHKGDLLARLSSDVDAVQNMVLEVPFFLVSHLLTLLFYCGMLFWIDWYLALVALMFVPLFVIHQGMFGPRKRKVSQRFYHEAGELLAFEEQALSNLRGISSVRGETRMAERHGECYERARHWGMKMRWLDQGFAVTLAAMIYFCGIIIVFVGIDRIESHGFGIGAMVSFLLYLGYLSVPVRGFAQAPMQLQGDLGAAQRLLVIFDMKPETKDAVDARPLEISEGLIRFEEICFAYPGGEPLLKGIDITIEPGETVALVGPSGAGKSTLARLLMRFYDPQQGRITIDATDIRKVTIASLREQFSIIWQSPFIMNDTIRANLLLVQADATEAQMISACEASGAWQFIAGLSDGLDTRVGTGGVELSGGQYQRIAIAQAMLRDTPFLIMDEATSALDSQSEKEVVAALDKLRSGRTTFIIAHRYSSIRNADRILYFNGNGDGSIAAASHDELYASHPAYRNAVVWQSDSGVK